MLESTTACPVCDAEVPLQSGLEESEILQCPDCQIRLVAVLAGPGLTLNVAPQIEEDWGQ